MRGREILRKLQSAKGLEKLLLRTQVEGLRQPAEMIDSRANKRKDIGGVERLSRMQEIGRPVRAPGRLPEREVFYEVLKLSSKVVAKSKCTPGVAGYDGQVDGISTAIRSGLGHMGAPNRMLEGLKEKDRVRDLTALESPALRETSQGFNSARRVSLLMQADEFFQDCLGIMIPKGFAYDAIAG
jgi:hypothetical protein